MAVHPPPVVEAVIEVRQDGARWVVRSSDRLFSGVFLDLKSAKRHAAEQADAHPGHVVVIRNGMAA